MSQAPYALRDARWGTKLGVDLKVSWLEQLHFSFKSFVESC